MNTEIVRRLRESFLIGLKPAELAANALFDTLDDALMAVLRDRFQRELAQEALADMAREDELIERDEAKSRED